MTRTMMRGTVALLLLLLTPEAQSACPDSAPWSRLPQTGAELIRPVPLILAAGAAAAPLTMAPLGIDQELRVLAQTDLGGRYDPEPVSVLAPYVLVGGLVFGWGLSVPLEACTWQKPFGAMLQAVLLTAGTTVLLKFAIGRTWPNGGHDPTAADRLEHPEWSTRFRPFGEGLAAWPSGHTGIMVAAAAALASGSPELGWLRFIGYPVALGVAAGMWLGDHHWASDIVSGALLGQAIGGAVGHSFAAVSAPDESETPQGAHLLFTPRLGGGLLVVSGSF